MSKSLGSRTVQTGYISKGKDNGSQSLQMMERPLMTADELKSMPKGQFIVMKTGAHPMKVKLKLFFQWEFPLGRRTRFRIRATALWPMPERKPWCRPSRKSTRPRKNPSSQRRKSSHPSRDRGTRNSMPAHLAEERQNRERREKMTDLKRLYQSELPSRAIAVYLYLRGRANKEGVCWPAIPTMARELKMSESTVRRGWRDLEKAGFLSVEERFRWNKADSSNLYVLVGQSSEKQLLSK